MNSRTQYRYSFISLIVSLVALIAAVLTIWSMVYYLQKALPEIRARVH